MERQLIKEASEYFESLRQSWPYIWTVFISTFAAIVQYVEKLKNGAKFNMRELICDVVICVFVGYTTVLVCKIAGISGDARDLVVIISAHMGTRALMQYEAFRNRILGLSTKGVKRGTISET
jgi:hypothetical protein